MNERIWSKGSSLHQQYFPSSVDLGFPPPKPVNKLINKESGWGGGGSPAGGEKENHTETSQLKHDFISISNNNI